MRKYFVHILFIAVTLFLNSCSTFFLREKSDYIRVNGHQFEFKG